jgi:hypothetical protein
LLAVAELERNIMIERTQEGKAITKQLDDFREGRPIKFRRKQIQYALQMLKTIHINKKRKSRALIKAS